MWWKFLFLHLATISWFSAFESFYPDPMRDFSFSGPNFILAKWPEMTEKIASYYISLSVGFRVTGSKPGEAGGFKSKAGAGAQLQLAIFRNLVLLALFGSRGMTVRGEGRCELFLRACNRSMEAFSIRSRFRIDRYRWLVLCDAVFATLEFLRSAGISRLDYLQPVRLAEPPTATR